MTPTKPDASAISFALTAGGLTASKLGGKTRGFLVSPCFGENYVAVEWVTPKGVDSHNTAGLITEAAAILEAAGYDVERVPYENDSLTLHVRSAER